MTTPVLSQVDLTPTERSTANGNDGITVLVVKDNQYDVVIDDVNQCHLAMYIISYIAITKSIHIYIVMNISFII